MTEAPVAKEANCLTSQHTKRSLKHQQSTIPESKPPLPRERFSPLAGSDFERLLTGEQSGHSARSVVLTRERREAACDQGVDAVPGNLHADAEHDEGGQS